MPTGRPITRDTLTAEQAHNLLRFERKLPAHARATRITALADGTVVFAADVPGRTVPGSYATYIKSVDADGFAVGFVKMTVAPDGSVVHVKDKMGHADES
jgi:hypothetical protein